MSMTYLYEKLFEEVTAWRNDGYSSENSPAIAEILKFASVSDSNTGQYLRKAQLRALETYWYLRIVESTPHIFDLYKKYFVEKLDLLNALGLDSEEIKNFVLNNGIEELWDRVRNDEDFVKENKIESIHETLTLEYPSYILALAMGAGKTILIGAIIATEFAMALEYHPDIDGPFIQNALVFAPGLTIIESLRELANIDYSRILPARFYKPFEVVYKIIFTRTNEQDIPVIRNSRYNLIVTNTEKIRIQKRNYRHSSWTNMQTQHMWDQYEAEANLRLRAIASLPNLGLFSDEAHHTYGKEMGSRLKRVRQTVDYLHENTNLIAVINTTGTPYYERQPLRDVVIWYGLSEGIKDGILKSVKNNIFAYDFKQENTDLFVTQVIQDFFETYGEIQLPNGSWSKLAIYFPQTKDLRELRPIIELTLLELGYSSDLILRNTSNSTQAEINAFNQLNNPDSSHRVILLVNKGTEGWDCPSLFACALARKLKTSKNFVLQASTRCLRQVPGNDHNARIYLSEDNRSTLDQQLRETYGETVTDLTGTNTLMETSKLRIRKMDIPPLVIKKTIKKIIPKRINDITSLILAKPDINPETVLIKKVYTPQESTGKQSVLQQIAEEQSIRGELGKDIFTTATSFSAIYRIDIMFLLGELKRLYGDKSTIPDNHIPKLAEQIEKHTCVYQLEEEEMEVALALLKHDGFTQEQDADGNTIYTTEITYRKDREHLLLNWRDMVSQNNKDFGFHYNPYNFDSNPERDFFQQVLLAINLDPDQVDDIFFTGGITDPRKTEFFIEYKGNDDKWHRYSPDFIVRRKDGRCYIVEIKAENKRDDLIDGENGVKSLAVRRWENLNPESLRYEMIFTSTDAIPFNKLTQIKKFVEECQTNDE